MQKEVKIEIIVKFLQSMLLDSPVYIDKDSLPLLKSAIESLECRSLIIAPDSQHKRSFFSYHQAFEHCPKCNSVISRAYKEHCSICGQRLLYQKNTKNLLNPITNNPNNTPTDNSK